MVFGCKKAAFQQGKVEALEPAAAAAAKAFSTIFSSDSEGTLGSFAVHFGRRFGTKLGGVLLQKSCVSARQGGGFGAR